MRGLLFLFFRKLCSYEIKNALQEAHCGELEDVAKTLLQGKGLKQKRKYYMIIDNRFSGRDTNEFKNRSDKRRWHRTGNCP